MLYNWTHQLYHAYSGLWDVAIQPMKCCVPSGSSASMAGSSVVSSKGSAVDSSRVTDLKTMSHSEHTWALFHSHIQ